MKTNHLNHIFLYLIRIYGYELQKTAVFSWKKNIFVL